MDTVDVMYKLIYTFVYGFYYLAAVAIFVLCSIGIFRIGKAHRLANGWMAWVPVLQMIYIARLADDCNRRLGKKSKLGRLTIISYLAGVSVALVACFALIWFVIAAFETNAPLSEEVGGVFVLSMVFLFPLVIGLSVWSSIMNYLCEWTIYRFWDEKNAVLYLLLSIFASASPVLFFILGLRAKKGEAPRSKEAKAAAEAYMQAVQAAQEAAAQEAAAAFDVQPVAAPEAVSEAVCELAPQATPEEAVAPIVAEAEQPKQPLMPEAKPTTDTQPPADFV